MLVDPYTLRNLSRPDKVEALQLLERKVILAEADACSNSLTAFTKAAWHVIEPATPLIWNWHLDVICVYLEFFFRRKIKRLAINVPPGTLKSIVFSVMGPAWVWTWAPHARMLNITNEITLATRDNRRMKQIVESDWYTARWGHKFQMSQDQREKTLFENTQRGFRQGLGIGGNITGKRGGYLLLDDLIDAKKAFSDVTIQTANETIDQSIGSRLNDPVRDCIGLIMQRLRTNDPTGHLMQKKARKWTHVVIPQEYEGRPGYDPVKDLGPEYAYLRDPRTKVGELLHPTRMPPMVIREYKENLGAYGYAGQHQQRPSPLSGGIIKRGHWRIWKNDKPFPKILHCFSSWDTAFTEQDFKENAYSARTDWGVWQDEHDVPAHAKLDPEHPEHRGRFKLLLLAAWWKRCDFDALITVAKDVQKRRLKRANDAHLIEHKASGHSLVQVLRKNATLRILTFDPKKHGGGDKLARAYSVQPLFSAGIVYVPDRVWAVGREATDDKPQENGVIDIISEFPAGAPPCADLIDTVSQALRYLQNGWWIHHPDDDLPPVTVNMDHKDNHRMRFDGEESDDNDSVVTTGSGGIYG